MKDLIYQHTEEGRVRQVGAWYPTVPVHRRKWSAMACHVWSKGEWQVHVARPGPVGNHRYGDPVVSFKTEEEAKGYLRQQIVILSLSC